MSKSKASLAQEIEVAEQLLKQAQQQGEARLINDLLKTLASLRKNQRIYEERSGETVSRERMIVFVRALATHIGDAFEGVPDFEQRMDSLVQKIEEEMDPRRLAPIDE